MKANTYIIYAFMIPSCSKNSKAVSKNTEWLLMSLVAYQDGGFSLFHLFRVVSGMFQPLQACYSLFRVVPSTSNDATECTSNDVTECTGNDITECISNDGTECTSNDITECASNDGTECTSNDVTECFDLQIYYETTSCKFYTKDYKRHYNVG